MRKTPSRKRTKTSVIKQNDKLFSQYIRSKGACERCGKREGLQCAHIYSRSVRAIRWEISNALSLCAGCHLFWAHKNPIEFTCWIQEKWPGRIEVLREKQKKLKALTLEDYLAVNQALKELLAPQ